MKNKSSLFDDYVNQWIYWWSTRAGNDGRRPSGIVRQQTKYQHFAKSLTRTLCNREINLYPTVASKGLSVLPKCKICEKRLSGGKNGN
jgi:hypothetical protein